MQYTQERKKIEKRKGRGMRYKVGIVDILNFCF